MDVSWGAPASDGGAEVTSYTVLRDGNPLTKVSGATRSYTDSDAGYASKHVYAVTATNDVGTGPAATAALAVSAVAPSITVDDIVALEGNAGTTPANLILRLSSPSVETVTVQVATANGTAVAGATGDYLATADVVTFAPGETSKTMPVPVRGDTTKESEETFFLDLSAASRATVGDTRAQVTIRNDDGKGPVAKPLPAMYVSDAYAVEGATGTTQLVFTVRLASAGGAVSATYTTVTQTATAGSDFTAVTGTVSIPAGQTTGTVVVDVVGDATVESNEKVLLRLSTPRKAVLADAEGVGTILDDD
jgi:hypothetical protein